MLTATCPPPIPIIFNYRKRQYKFKYKISDGLLTMIFFEICIRLKLRIFNKCHTNGEPNLLKSINSKKAGGRGLEGVSNWAPLCFFKNASSKNRVKSWFFATSNIVISLIFPENFIEIPHIVRRYEDFHCQY